MPAPTSRFLKGQMDEGSGTKKIAERDPVPGLPFQLVIGKTMPLLQPEQFHEHDHLGMRSAPLVGVALVER
jgi:hypothetical protein